MIGLPSFRPAFFGGLSEITHVLFAGDSFIDQDSAYVPASNLTNFSGGGLGMWFQAYLGQRLERVRRSDGAYDFGDSGERADQYWTATGVGGKTNGGNVTDAVALLPDPSKCLVLLHIGTNDLNAGDAAATVLSDVQALIANFEALGCKVLPFTVAPRSYSASGPDEAVVLVQRLAYNELLKAARPCIDIGTLGDDNADGYQDSGMGDASRPGHPFEVLASRIGKTAADYVSSRYGLPDMPDLTTFTAVNTNPTMSGTGGSVFSPATGQAATSYFVSINGSGTTCTASKTPEGYQKLVCGIPSSGEFYVAVRLGTDLNSGFVAGDTLELWADIETEATGFDLRRLQLNMQATAGGASWTVQSILRTSSTHTLSVERGTRMIFRSPAVTLGASPVNLNLFLRIYGAGTYIIRDLRIRKVS